MKKTLKTKLLKKWRKEANARIGVFERDNGRFIIVFDKSWYGSVSDFSDDYDGKNMKPYQIMEEEYETLKEAKMICDCYRRRYILREARKEYCRYKFGNPTRKY